MLVAVRIKKKKKKKKIIVCWREKKVIMNFVSIAKGSGRPHRWLHLYCCIVYLCFFFSFFLSFSPSLSIYVYIYILFFSLTSACSSIFSFSPLPFIKEIKSKKKLTYRLEYYLMCLLKKGWCERDKHIMESCDFYIFFAWLINHSSDSDGDGDYFRFCCCCCFCWSSRGSVMNERIVEVTMIGWMDVVMLTVWWSQWG